MWQEPPTFSFKGPEGEGFFTTDDNKEGLFMYKYRKRQVFDKNAKEGNHVSTAAPVNTSG